MLSINKNVLLGSLPGLENKIVFIWGSYEHDWPNPTVTEVQVTGGKDDCEQLWCNFCVVVFVVCEACPI